MSCHYILFCKVSNNVTNTNLLKWQYDSTKWSKYPNQLFVYKKQQIKNIECKMDGKNWISMLYLRNIYIA